MPSFAPHSPTQNGHLAICRSCSALIPTSASTTATARGLEQTAARAAAALTTLVWLKDGARDESYRAAKDQAWQDARDALALPEVAALPPVDPA